jgi:hypothetical protein
VRQRAHHGHVEGGDGEVEPRALRLRDVRGPAAHIDPAGLRLELAEQDAEQRGLAPAVRTEDAHGLAALRAEGDVGQGRRAVVGGDEVLDRDDGGGHVLDRCGRALSTRHTLAPSTATGGPGGTSSQYAR